MLRLVPIYIERISSKEEVVKRRYLIALILTLSPLWEHIAFACEPHPVSYWPLDESSGTTAYDSAGNHNGSVYGAQWTTNGHFGGALLFDGINDYVNIGNLGLYQDWTVCFWAKSNDNSGVIYYPIAFDYPYSSIVMGGNHLTYRQHIAFWDGYYNLKSETSIQTNVWNHIAIAKNGATYSLYINGVCENSNTGKLRDTDLRYFKLGTRPDLFKYFNGTIDDVGVWNSAIELGDIKDPNPGTINYIRINGISELPSGIAHNPSVPDRQTDVDVNETLSWRKSESAADINGHNVYFSTDFDEVDNGLIDYVNVSSPEFYPGILAFNTTYYWKVDEVNDSNVWQGNVWRFTTLRFVATNPNPANNATNVDLNNLNLTWRPVNNQAVTHMNDIYTGTDSYAVTHSVATLRGDIDDNNLVNLDDFSIISSEWLDTPGISEPNADLDLSGEVDFIDFSIMSGDWTLMTSDSYKGRQDINIYTPPDLQYETTYYWRIDEVEGNTISPGDTWSFTTKTEGALPTATNAASPLAIPTYDGSGQAMHPSIIYFPDEWQGYKYWMAMTPFTYSNNQTENPSIVTSNDGLSWEVPSGLTNPLIWPTGNSGYNADPELVYNDDANELWLYFKREWPNTNEVKLALMKSCDGINWTSPEYLISWNISIQDREKSYSIIKQGADWHYWAQSFNAPHDIFYRYSVDGENWSGTQNVLFSPVPSLPWHLDVLYVPTKSEYWMLFNAGGGAWGSGLFFAKSTDRINWTFYTNEILAPSGAGWDNCQIYRPSFLYDSDTQTIRIWYSASDTFLKWGTGYTEVKY